MIYSEKIALDNINREKAEIAEYKDTVFMMENKIVKLESEINLLRKKRQEKYKDDEFHYNFKEVYIIDPCQAVMNINDELILYKNIYASLSNHYRALQISINQYETIIQELKYDNAKLEREIRDKDKIIMLSTANTKVMNTHSHLSKLQTEMNIREEDINKRLSTHNDDTEKPQMKKLSSTQIKKTGLEYDSESSYDMNKHKVKQIIETYCPSNPLTPITPIQCFSVPGKKIDKLDISEWKEVVRIVGFTEEEYNNIFVINNKYSKISEAIDIFNSIIVDRNQQINILNLENSKLNNENKVLYDENLLLNKKISLLEQKNTNLMIYVEELKFAGPKTRSCHLELNSTICDNNHTIETNKNELIMNSIANTPSSMITINRVNIKALNQITTTRQYEKSGNSDKLLDYYKKVHVPEDSSYSEFDDEDLCSNKKIILKSAESIRKRLYTINSAENRKKKLKINISNEHAANYSISKPSTTSKRSIKTISNSTSVNCDTNRRANSTMKSRVMERLDMQEKRECLQESPTHLEEFIKIEDQKDAFFELSHNTKALKDIQEINRKEAIEKDLTYNMHQQLNPSVNAMDKLLNLSNKEGEPKINSCKKRKIPGSTLSKHGKVNDLNNLIENCVNSKIEAIKLKDSKQVFNSENQFKEDIKTIVNENNIKQDTGFHAK